MNWTIGDVYREAFETYKENFAVCFLSMLIAALLNGLAGITYIGPIIIGGPLLLGLSIVYLNVVRKQPAEVGMVFNGFSKFVPAFVAWLLISIFAGIGTLFCIIPGIIISVLYLLTLLILADNNIGGWEAMEASRKTVQPQFMQWFLLMLVNMLVCLAGAMVCGIGLFFAAPLAWLALVIAYTKTVGTQVSQQPLNTPTENVPQD